jgi:excisionase family DNA binding protein
MGYILRRREMEPGLMRIEEAARYLAIGRSTMYELVAQGAVPTVHIGRAVRIPTEALKQLVESWSMTSGLSKAAA